MPPHSHRAPPGSLLVLLGLLGCSDNGLNSTKDKAFDSGDEADSGAADSDSAGDSGDSGSGGGELAPLCDSREYPGEALPPHDGCGAEPAPAPTWGLTPRWQLDALGFGTSTPVLANLTDDNGDGDVGEGDTPDVVYVAYEDWVWALDGETGGVLWSADTGGVEQGTAAVADVDGDGRPEVFVQALFGSVLLAGDDGSVLWTGPRLSASKTACGGAGIADFDGDGAAEIYFGRLVLDGATGATRMEGTEGSGTSLIGEGAISAAADLDLDGQQELVAGNTVYRLDGTVVWTRADRPDGFPAVANLDADAEAEVVVSSHDAVYVYDTDGSDLWSATFPRSSYGGPPAVADIDGDGAPEVLVPYSYGLLVYEADGTALWSVSHSDATPCDGVSAYDLDGDGAWEVLHTSIEGFFVYAGDGRQLAEWSDDGLYACGQNVSVADLDGDGDAELAVPFGSAYGGPTGVAVLDDPGGLAAAPSGWNQDPYSITHMGLDNVVPASPSPNWLEPGLDNFRAGPPVADRYVDVNLVGRIVDVCLDNCAQSELVVWWALGNDGGTPIDEPIQVELWGVTDGPDVLLYATTWTDALPPLRLADAVETRFAGVPHPLYDLRLEVDGGADPRAGTLFECDETDNVAEWGTALCP